MKYPTHTKGAAIAVLALAGSASAISPQNGYEIGGSNAIAWPTSLGTPGDFRRIVLGEFAGNVTPGALALVGDKAVYLYDPAVHQDVTEVAASGVNDVAALAPGAPGTGAGMLLAKTDGLYLASLDCIIEPATSGPGTIQTTQLATGNFADLDLVRSGNINGEARDDVVGSSGANVYVLLHSNSGWAAGSSFQASSTVREFEVLDWDDDGDGDIAIRLDQSVEIRESDGDLIETQAGYASGGFLARIPPTDLNASERLGWALPMPSPSTTHALLVLSYPGTRVSCGFFSQVPGSLLSAILKDTYGATRVDLLASRPANREVMLYPARTTTPPYTAASPLTYDVGSMADAGDGPPAFGDITLDGIPDVIAGRGALNSFVVVAGGPPTLAGVFNPEDTWSAAWLIKDTDALPWFGVTVTPPNVQGYSHLQTVLWWSTDGEELEPAAIGNFAWELNEEEPIDVWLPLGDSTLEDVCEPFEEGFAISVRLVYWDEESPTVSAASSPLYAVFCKDEDTAENMLPPDAPDPVAFFEDNCGGQSPGIGYTPVVTLPPKRSGVLPSVPLLVEGGTPTWDNPYVP